METLIVTGLSGAGKSQALQILEDMGYFCVDNLPARLIPTFIDLCHSAGAEVNRIALVTDVRGDIFNTKTEDFYNFKEKHTETRMLFIEADDKVLINRYQTSRRKHPLTDIAGNLSESLAMERDKMASYRDVADFIIDTTSLSVAELKTALNEILKEEENLSYTQVNITSFGYKYGIPQSADYVFDVRFLPNPFYKEDLRGKTGRDNEVREYVFSFPEADMFFNKIEDIVEWVLPEYRKIGKAYIEVAIGCTGGQHRSVSFVYKLEKNLIDKGYSVKTMHRDILKDREAVNILIDS